jgi:RNA recognition motif-containing protein
MTTITRLIDYIEKADNKLEQCKKQGQTNTEFYVKLQKYRNSQKKLYDNMMRRKTTWEPFGRALSENNDNCTTQGDEIFMEMVNEQKTRDNNKPEYMKYYDNMNISDKMKKENYNRFKECSKKYKTVKELYTDANNSSYHIYVTKDIAVEKYNKKFEIPKEAIESAKQKGPKSNKTLDDLFKEKDMEENNSKYVPPSYRKGANNSNMEEPNRKLIIRNIPRDIMEDNIADLIMTCGKLYDVRIHRDKYTGESKGFAFIKCETHETAKKIINTYNGKPLGMLIMKIDFAEDKKKKYRH